uniref:Uncharacterized protein n=1 Tax=Arundo donax TaxID=35708 RepID=A0A0A8ZE85_ARUDO
MQFLTWKLEAVLSG